MAMLPIFPKLPGLSYGITRSNNGFGNVRQKSVSGLRTDFPSRNLPIRTWTLPFEFLRSKSLRAIGAFSDGGTFGDGSGFSTELRQEFQTLEGFWSQTFGGATPFLYLDPDDSVVTNQVIGYGDGATLAFQLVRTFGGFTEPVYAQDNSQIIVDGTLLVQDAGYSINDTGLVTLVAAPAVGASVIWAGTYYWRCRFDDDAIEFENFMKSLWTLKKLSFSSELLP